MSAQTTTVGIISRYAASADVVRRHLDTRKVTERGRRIVLAVLRASLENGQLEAWFPATVDLQVVTRMTKGNFSHEFRRLEEAHVIEVISREAGVYALHAPASWKLKESVPETDRVLGVWARVLAADPQRPLAALEPEPGLNDALREDFALPSGGGVLPPPSPSAQEARGLVPAPMSLAGSHDGSATAGGAGTARGGSRAQIASGAATAARESSSPASADEDALARFTRKWPAKPELVPGSGTDCGQGAMLPAKMVPESGTGSRIGNQTGPVFAASVPESGTKKAQQNGAGSRFGNRATVPRAQAIASPDQEVQELAKAEFTALAVTRMQKLSPREWSRYSAVWMPVAQKRPRRLLGLLDGLEAEIERRETSGDGKPIERPLAWLYRRAEDQGLVREVRKLNSL